MPIEPVRCVTGDGVELEAELHVPDDTWAATVLLHPHPQHGGNMRSVVPGTLFDFLPRSGVAALRFNFRGVGASTGRFGGGLEERQDVLAAMDVLHPIVEGLPFVLAGWSFGGDVSLAVGDERVTAWSAVAAPLRVMGSDDLVAGPDPRPKLLLVPEHDQFRDPASAHQFTSGWVNTRIEIVPGADHFLLGRTEHVAESVLSFLRELS